MRFFWDAGGVVSLHGTRSGSEPLDFSSLPKATPPLLTFKSQPHAHTHTVLGRLWQLQPPPKHSHRHLCHHTAVLFLLTSRNPGHLNPRTACARVWMCVCLQGLLGATARSLLSSSLLECQNQPAGSTQESKHFREMRRGQARSCIFITQVHDFDPLNNKPKGL